ncbi:helix-turn-helix domain-containing protein [Nocardiopsis halophila]|uniref:helix-turn-helix domain-containing protein n=1 Tax=Nocardiopsis halophila TaxID=141692 RepID=UPI000475A28F|nr:helix-turn-helix transcriptional regulator [Nocardiopsis halophila]
MVVNRLTAMERFGAEVRRTRVSAGISQQELAAAVLASQSTVSDFECGKKRPKRNFAVEIDRVLTAEGRLVTAWDHAFKAYEPPEWFRELPLLERRALEIQEYHPLLVPGLVQTEDYARASIEAGDRRVPRSYVGRKVQERVERQAILQGEEAPFLSVVLDESVLRRRVGSPATMKGQLDHLRAIASWEQAEVLVVPAATLNHPGLEGGFKLVRLPESNLVLYQETRSGGGVVVDQELVDEHMALMADLRGVALPPEQSLALMEQVQGEIE